VSRGLVEQVLGDRRHGEEELADENDVQELESVLEEALARQLPQQMLGWHYRSYHDSLIAFSNARYYGDRLQVFPAAKQSAADLGLHWHPVPGGVYQGSSAPENPRTNPREAEVLVTSWSASGWRGPSTWSASPARSSPPGAGSA
jgi:superfamily I DNA and/or RNA helicase